MIINQKEVKKVANEEGRWVTAEYLEALNHYIKEKIRADCRRDQKKKLGAVHCHANGLGRPAENVLGMTRRKRSKA